MEDIYFLPSLSEFKTQFNGFAYGDDTEFRESNDISIINAVYLEELLKAKTEEVAKKIIDSGYTLPTAENKYPTFSIKQYIMFSVACVFTSSYASNSDLINWIREQTKYYEEKFNTDFSQIVVGQEDSENVRLFGDVPKQ